MEMIRQRAQTGYTKEQKMIPTVGKGEASPLLWILVALVLGLLLLVPYLIVAQRSFIGF